MFWRFTELHYSQTDWCAGQNGFEFWRFTELHYSQTTHKSHIPPLTVLEIYRITLLSNYTYQLLTVPSVLEIYRITLLSNGP